MDVRFLGHACFELSDDDTTMLVDPFLTGNSEAAAKAAVVVLELGEAHAA
jgi:L-ascorbate metabolism protein UlaG (beta-lactamase superfamily)